MGEENARNSIGKCGPGPTWAHFHKTASQKLSLNSASVWRRKMQGIPKENVVLGPLPQDGFAENEL